MTPTEIDVLSRYEEAGNPDGKTIKASTLNTDSLVLLYTDDTYHKVYIADRLALAEITFQDLVQLGEVTPQELQAYQSERGAGEAQAELERQKALMAEILTHYTPAQVIQYLQSL